MKLPAKVILGMAVAAMACGSVTLAQTGSSAQLIKERQQGLKALGAAFKVIRDELRGESPDPTKIRTASTDITKAAGAIGSWFPAGTGPESGAKTDAKPEIWTDAAGFAAARDAFIREADKWSQLGANSDTAAWKEAAGSLGQSCKGCHEKYRVKRE
jgi:cytochrome c556